MIRIIMTLLAIVLVLGCSRPREVISEATGWRASGKNSWVRDNVEVADHNGDGLIDYRRVQDPPGSYRHVIWSDTDADGYFDQEIDLGENRPIDLLVPQVEDAADAAK